MATLLIVDDDQTLLGLLSEVLSDDHLCHAASNAEEALSAMAARDYDLILTDLSMPGLGGEALLGFAKSNCPRTPVVFISGALAAERWPGLQARGAFDYLQKPLQISSLAEGVGRALTERRRRLTASCT